MHIFLPINLLTPRNAADRKIAPKFIGSCKRDTKIFINHIFFQNVGVKTIYTYTVNCRGILRIEHPRPKHLKRESNPGLLHCTAGEHSMQRAIQRALLTAIRNLGLDYYIAPPPPQAAMSQALDLGLWLGRGYI